jgi:hypothetical protein
MVRSILWRYGSGVLLAALLVSVITHNAATEGLLMCTVIYLPVVLLYSVLDARRERHREA